MVRRLRLIAAPIAVASHVMPGQTAAQHRPRPSEKRGEFNGKTEQLPGQNAFRAVVPTRNCRSVWTIATRRYKGAHFATFPPALVEPCILAGSRPGDIVLDPFNGSGTTEQGALQYGRRYLGVELNPEYVELTRARLDRVIQAKTAAAVPSLQSDMFAEAS
jgi:DNA modification methylase